MPIPDQKIYSQSDLTKSVTLPAISNPTPNCDPVAILRQVKEIVETREGLRGNALEASPTWKDLINAGIASTKASDGSTLTGTGAVDSPFYPTDPSWRDFAYPPAPVNVRAVGAFATIIVKWTPPDFLSFSHAEVWRANNASFSDAVIVGTTKAAIYVDNVGGGATHYYWVRFVNKAGITGPFNDIDGIEGQTAYDPAYLLEVLQGKLSNSSLGVDLAKRINMIDDPDTVPGSISAKIKSVQTTLTDDVSALASQVDTISATTQTTAAAIQTEATARAAGDSANATAIQQVQARLNTGDFAAVKTESSANANSIDGLEAQYTVKVQVTQDGKEYVSGYGLATTAKDGTPTSEFIVLADKFAVGAPGQVSKSPFVIVTTPIQENGVTVPVGVYMDGAFIKNGTISSAKIGLAAIDDANIASLDAGKINTGYLSSDRIEALSIKAGQIDTRGLTIKDAQGNILLGAGTGLDWSNVVGSTKPADNATKNQVFKQDTAPTGSLSNGDFWVKTSPPQAIYTYTVGTGWVKHADMTIDNVAAAILGQGQFATLNKITPYNIGVYIDQAAIGSAYIGDLDAGKITTGYLNANRIQGGSLSGVNLLIADASGNWILRANVGGYDGVSMWKPVASMLTCSNLGNPTVPACDAQGYNSEVIVGKGVSYSATNHGVRGLNTAFGTSGLVGVCNGYDFYADGAGTANYGPFTGAHDALVTNADEYELGDIVVDVACKAKKGVSNTLFEVRKSSAPNQKAVIGVVAYKNGRLADIYKPAVFDPTTGISENGETPVNEYTDNYLSLKDEYDHIIINALGEGQLLVCGENGDIEAGDLIVSSSIPGKGMRQADDLVRSYTVAKAREAVTFSAPDEVKLVPCIYLCG